MLNYKHKKLLNPRSFRVVLAISILITAISCVPTKKLKYLNDINELSEPISNPRGQKQITAFDKLYIQVISIDEKTNQLLNTNSGASGGGAVADIGYLVDESGNINYPFVGKINLGNLTLDQANIKLGEALSQYVSVDAVNIRFIDRTVTLLGEVGGQGSFSFNKDKLTIYEALALGGGISRFGDRKNVVLIRQEGEKLMHYKLDLTSSRIAEKDFFYILSNDIIIVEPMRATSWFNYNNSNFSTFASLLSLVVVAVSMFFRNQIY